jgi:regulation of enolase protein 1 (concanavalin A-like superfamily)
MRLILSSAIILLCCTFFSCAEKHYTKAENALDAGREFIDGCLKGDFDQASYYMLQDDENKSLLLQQKRNYDAKSKEEKQQYNNASIIIYEDAAVNDSTHVINYQNSYDKVGRKVKVVLKNNTWLVDFKYTFNPNL